MAVVNLVDFDKVRLGHPETSADRFGAFKKGVGYEGDCHYAALVECARNHPSAPLSQAKAARRSSESECRFEPRASDFTNRLTLLERTRAPEELYCGLARRLAIHRAQSTIKGGQYRSDNSVERSRASRSMPVVVSHTNAPVVT
jgi:hypothetical protein